jgi:predicted ABC-type ATPase
MSDRPQIAILGGINGAGKTSSSEPILKIGMRIPVFVNADTIARGLNAFNPESEAVRAGRIMLEHLRNLAGQRKSFAFETTLAARTYADWLAELRQTGYSIHLLYYWLKSPDLAIERVADRVRSGGHYIPEDTIRRRYSRSVRNFLELYRPVVNTWQVYDNSDVAPQLIAFNNSFFDTIVLPDRWEMLNRGTGDDGQSDAAKD